MSIAGSSFTGASLEPGRVSGFELCRRQDCVCCFWFRAACKFDTQPKTLDPQFFCVSGFQRGTVKGFRLTGVYP